LAGCQPSAQVVSELSADQIYFGGDILTMEGEEPQYAQAIAVKDGNILELGSLATIEAFKGDNTEIIDLKGSTLMPGLVDPHLHPSLGAILIQTEIIAFNEWDLPSGKIEGALDQESYLARLDQAVAEHTDKTKPLISWGYHQLFHGELFRADLDRRYPHTAVVLWQYSFHELRMNKKALEMLAIDENKTRQHPSADYDKGWFYETGAQTLVGPKLLSYVLQPDAFMQGMTDIAQAIHQGGITLAGDMSMPQLTFEPEIQAAQQVLANDNTHFRTLFAPAASYFSKDASQLDKGFARVETLKQYNTEKIQFTKQIKLYADGAFFSQLMQMNEVYTDGHHGEWLMQPDQYRQYARYYWNKGYQLHVHVNGDKGVDLVLDSLKVLLQQSPKQDHRTTLHHLGYFTEAQAQRMAKLGAIASVNPYYFYSMADKFAQHGLGKERAANLTALSLLEKHNVLTTYHSDSFMAPAEPLLLAWTAVERETLLGAKPSPELAASPYKALQAITINGAYQLRREHESGSLRAGKRADFVILSSNPLKIPSADMANINIETTVLGGIASAL